MALTEAAPQDRDDRALRIERASSNSRTLTPEQVALLKTTICRDATDDELRMFVGICGRTGLDPFTKQIHFVKRWDSKGGPEGKGAMVGAIQIGIDGYRLIASRTGKYGGQDACEWIGTDGAWRDIWLEDEPPVAARVKVYHLDFPDRPVVGIARWKAYVQTTKEGSPNRMWSTRDAEQLEKCAEALALRKAFANELTATMIGEELPSEDALMQRDPRATRALRSVEKAAAREVSSAVEEMDLGSVAPPVEVIAQEGEPIIISEKEFEAACAKAKSVLNWPCLKKPSGTDQVWFVLGPVIKTALGDERAALGSVQWKDDDRVVMAQADTVALYKVLREAIDARVRAA